MAKMRREQCQIIVVFLLDFLLSVALGGQNQVSSSFGLSRLRSFAVTHVADGRQVTISTGGHSDRDEAFAARQTDALSASGGVSSTAGHLSVPPRCPGNCTAYGTCNEELGRCDCPMGWTGADCSQSIPKAERQELCNRNGHTDLTCGKDVELPMCLNACSFRGRCVGGFCHCRPRFFGADCSLSLSQSAAGPAAAAGDGLAGSVEVLAGQGYSVRPSGPRIYVYELPPHMNTYQNLERLDRPLMYMLWQRWLSAGLRVADPAVADFFFVPVRVRLAYDSDRVVEALSYIKSTWPYWNATGGLRHVFVHTGDWGRDELSEDVQLMTWNATWLTHWGLARDHEFAGWKQAHRPGRDIVLPLMMQASVISHYRMVRASPLHPAGPRPERRRTLFFSGRVCGSRAHPSINGTYPNCPNVLGKEDAYSAATRQRSFFYHHNRTNWKVVTRTRSYAYDMVTSKFCLAPSGAGQGKRSVLSVLMGCLPVTVTDGLLQPFEPEMRWEGFAIDVRERDIPLMHELLERLRGDQVAEFQGNLRCAAQHLFWSSMYGSVFGEDGRYDAFETLVQVLRMRVMYPTLGPEEYAYVDPAFAAFLNCREPPALDALVGVGPVPQPGAGGSNSVGGDSFGNGGGGGNSSSSSWSGMGALAKPGLQKILSDGSRPMPLPRRLATVDLPTGSGAVVRQPLCSHSLLPTAPGVSSCSRCVRRRGRLLNPGGTICCNTRELAKCPRLWD